MLIINLRNKFLKINIGNLWLAIKHSRKELVKVSDEKITLTTTTLEQNVIRVDWDKDAPHYFHRVNEDGCVVAPIRLVVAP